jgi:hypothetical protein
MTYTLLAIFLLTGDAHIERQGLSLQSCAGRAAMARQEAAPLFQYIGEVQYECRAEYSLARKSVEVRQ